MSTTKSRPWQGLLLLGSAALALRVALVLLLAGRADGPRTYEHGEIAENLLAGRGFSVAFLGQEGPTSQQAPLYPALLAGLYRTFGVGANAVLAMQLLQCLAGAALAVAVVWLCWSLMPQRRAVGWIAGWGAALYPTHIYMVTHVQVAVWAALSLTLLCCTVFSSRWGGRGGAALAGLLGGITMLFEPILALALPILALAMWRRAAGQRQPHSLVATRLLLFAGVATLVVSPWVWRNYQVHGEFVFVKSTFGYAFWQGNNAHSWGTDKIPKASAASLLQQHDGTLAGRERAMWEARHETLYIDDVLLKPGGYRQFAGLTEPQRSRLLGHEAQRFIAENPGQYARLCLARLRYFFTFDPTNPKAANLAYRATTVIWLALFAAGLWLGRREWRALWPTAAIVAAVALFHALTIVSARFRIPVEPLSFVCAALAVAAIGDRCRAMFPSTAARGEVIAMRIAAPRANPEVEALVDIHPRG